MKKFISIVICTCNRDEHLRETLRALVNVDVPPGISVELLIVDNASTDATAQVVNSCSIKTMQVRYLYEGRRGQCYARNSAIAESQGSVIIFIDDDVRPPHNWIANMTEPILNGKVAAIAGGVRIANHLRRSWMHPLALTWFASTEGIDDAGPVTMLGANCAFSREVLCKVPGYDVELGPGRLGFVDDLLFSWQIHRAGYKMGSALNTAVEHHFDPGRLTRTSLISRSLREGHSQAYFDYHLLHGYSRLPRIRLWQYRLQLVATRLMRWRDCRAQEGMQEWEMRLLERVGFWQQYLKERRRPRNYEKHGLVKIAGERYTPPSGSANENSDSNVLNLL